MFVWMKRSGVIGVSMRWWIASESPNQMPEPSLAEQESYKKIQEQTFLTNLVEDEQRFKEFWPFYLNFEIIDPLRNVSRGSLLDPSDDEKDLELKYFPWSYL